MSMTRDFSGRHRPRYKPKYAIRPCGAALSGNLSFMPSPVGMDQSAKSTREVSWLRETDGLLITAGADVVRIEPCWVSSVETRRANESPARWRQLAAMVLSRAEGRQTETASR
jgi:hypothetical protein